MEQKETQLLVIGGGAAGMAAASEASEHGVKVIVAEANNNVGGNGLFPRGVFAVGSPMQKNRLILPDKDQVFRDCMNYSHWKIDGRIIRALIEKSGETIGWLMDKGVKFVDVVHHIPNQTPEVFHITDKEENAGRAVIKALKQHCAEHDVEILTKTRGKKLNLDEEGNVTGAVFETPSGELTIKAEKVIICTGGFAGNSQMIEKYYPNYDESKVPAGPGMRNPGDGLQMAMEAGADIDGNFTMEIAAPKIQGYGPLNLQLGKPYNVWLNSFGQRFADEGIVYNFAMAANACLRQPDARMYVMFNQAALDKTLRDGRDMIELIHIPLDAEEHLEESIKEAIEGGVLCKSDSLSDIAEFMDVSLEDLEDEIWEYNTFCASGHDKIFAKDRRYLKSLEEGPYYCVKAGCDMLITHGGIRVDEHFRALDKSHLPIGNLYVAGVDFGGADADVYNVEMSGHGFGFALNSGRIAAEAASLEIQY